VSAEWGSLRTTPIKNSQRQSRTYAKAVMSVGWANQPVVYGFHEALNRHAHRPVRRLSRSWDITYRYSNRHWL